MVSDEESEPYEAKVSKLLSEPKGMMVHPKEGAMATPLQRAADTLFPQEGGRIRNVKFHQGRGRTVTAEQLVGELLSANEQIASGAATRVLDIDGDLNV
jgi:hypothetical protein